GSCMRWSIIRVIWLRELRDQLRDRRTVFMIVVLPLLIYPLAGLGLMQFAGGFLQKPSVVGVWGAEDLPPEPAPGTAADSRSLAWPRLIERNGSTGRFSAAYFFPESEQNSIQLHFFDGQETAPTNAKKEKAFLDRVRGPLDRREVDLLIVVRPDFLDDLEKDTKPTLYVLSRPDERSLLAKVRAGGVLTAWKRKVKNVRFVRKGLPEPFDEPFALRYPAQTAAPQRRPSEALLDLLVRIFPFVLVMWSLAGALYPAV